jgi:hypothetical protein
MAKKSKKAKRTPGVYCVTMKKAAGTRCLRKYNDGRVRFLKKGNIQCPKSCRKS